ncbi:WD40-repeat-containing domain protein [Suillus subaureus]|uniref:Beta'-coat protein n=1 Tax=Suillus subaureus TaxID=48587 RepID=A0A9P7DMZ8_9AGAM|nr:WD40-repeat-containing domain protein [Suillus subaureus]KAG1798794.1 WD40-repeat-containing domain protein [Suillus subaureus]
MLEAHPDYIQCLTVHPTASIVLTGSDDMTIKAWDWDEQWKCIQVYEGHTHYIINITFNPKDSNTFASACLDRTIKMWSLASPTANFTMDAHDKGINYVDFYPGLDKPYLQKLRANDGRTHKIKEISTTEIFVKALLHLPNGRFMTVVSDGEYIIYMVLAWAGDSNMYAVLESKVKLRVFKNFKEHSDAGMKGTRSWAVDAIYGGLVLGTHGKGFVIFWDWESGEIVRHIDVDAKNDTRGGYAHNSKLEEGVEITDEGVEESFDVVAEISDSMKNQYLWVFVVFECC